MPLKMRMIPILRISLNLFSSPPSSRVTSARRVPNLSLSPNPNRPHPVGMRFRWDILHARHSIRSQIQHLQELQPFRELVKECSAQVPHVNLQAA